MKISQINKIAKQALLIESNAIKSLADHLGENFEKAVKLIMKTEGKLVISGIGKSGIIAAKIAASFTSTGKQSVFLNPVDASHGDLGVISKNDLHIILSNSGETHELTDLINFAKKMNNKIISITSNKNSLLAKASDIKLTLPAHKEADILNMIPTTSTTLSLALGDALCCTVLSLRKFDKKSFKELHPGGKIGKKLRTLKEIMDSDLPIVKLSQSIIDAVLIMTEKKYGCALVLDGNKNIKGIITDGDLRRAINKIDLNNNVKKIMQSKPILANEDMLISSAIALMNKNSITSLIISKSKKAVGIVNLKKCLDNE
jgi:arabinose-5-phosphate isomerase